MRSEQDLLSGVALTSFRLNGQLLDVAERLAAPAGLTAARWQVLGAVLRQPLTVAGIARDMGLTRQSVQRTADVLVDLGMLVRLPNPAHRRAPLMGPTEAGLAAVRAINPQHAALAARLAATMGQAELDAALESMTALSAALDALDAAAPAER